MNKLLLCLLFVPTILSAQTPILDEVREIVTSDSGTVQKWVHPIKMMVMYDDQPFDTEVNAIVENFNKIDGFPGITEVEFFDLNQIEGDLYGQTIFRKFHFERDDVPLIMGAAVFENGGDTIYTQADIYVFLADIEVGVLFGALAAPINRTVYSSAFASGASNLPCYSNVIAEDNLLETGLVFIDHNKPPEQILQCLYGRVIRTLGLQRDIADSDTFTFNDLLEPRLDTSADFDLLRALYSARVNAGDLPDAVIAEFEQLAAQGDEE